MVHNLSTSAAEALDDDFGNNDCSMPSAASNDVHDIAEDAYGLTRDDEYALLGIVEYP